MKLAEIAAEINDFLKKFEQDPKTNPTSKTYGTRPFYQAVAYAAGSRVGVRYVAYQRTSNLKKAEAITYLEWLRNGNVGTHYQVKA